MRKDQSPAARWAREDTQRTKAQRERIARALALLDFFERYCPSYIPATRVATAKR